MLSGRTNINTRITRNYTNGGTGLYKGADHKKSFDPVNFTI